MDKKEKENLVNLHWKCINKAIKPTANRVFYADTSPYSYVLRKTDGVLWSVYTLEVIGNRGHIEEIRGRQVEKLFEQVLSKLTNL